MLNHSVVAEDTLVRAPRATAIGDLPDETRVVRDSYKRPFDLAVIILSHVLLFPLWLLLWTLIPLMIWLEDRGPVFYTQERLGKDGVPFPILKFRTMLRDAEALTGPVWASENDERTTKVGQILRRLHLDEMPQIVNIVKNEMSLVGPRPERPSLAAQFDFEVPGFSQRLQVRPGVTGLAQLRVGYSARPRCKLGYDLRYIEKMSPWLDFWLLLVSVPVVIGRWFTEIPMEETGVSTPGEDTVGEEVRTPGTRVDTVSLSSMLSWESPQAQRPLQVVPGFPSPAILRHRVHVDQPPHEYARRSTPSDIAIHTQFGQESVAAKRESPGTRSGERLCAGK